MANLSILIKAIMTNRVNFYGKVDTDATEEDGARVVIVAPNRFGPGYITLIMNGEKWSAHFKGEGLTTPRQEPLHWTAVFMTYREAFNQETNPVDLTAAEYGRYTTMQEH